MKRAAAAALKAITQAIVDGDLMAALAIFTDLGGTERQFAEMLRPAFDAAMSNATRAQLETMRKRVDVLCADDEVDIDTRDMFVSVIDRQLRKGTNR